MNNKWVSFSPHLKSSVSTTKIYLFMMALLCPVIAVAAITLNLYPLLTVLMSITSAIVADVVSKIVAVKKYEFSDLSAVFIGLVIGVLMPTGAKFWVPIVPTIISVIFIRNIAGGIGKNFVSEIAVSVILASLMFPAAFGLYETGAGLSQVSFAESVLMGQVDKINVSSLLFGGISGTIADTAGLWVIVAGIVLMISGLVDYKVPLTVIASTFIFGVLFFDFTMAVNLTFGGGVIMVALFVATDYAVVPKETLPKMIYAFLFGFVIALLWKFTNNQMSVYYAAVIMGLLGCVTSGILRNYKNRRA